MREINGYECARCGALYVRLAGVAGCDHSEDAGRDLHEL